MNLIFIQKYIIIQINIIKNIFILKLKNFVNNMNNPVAGLIVRLDNPGDTLRTRHGDGGGELGHCDPLPRPGDERNRPGGQINTVNHPAGHVF